MNNFFGLNGKTITKLNVDDVTTIETSDGKRYQLSHSQDCCESVRHEKTIGEIENVLNSPITLAEEDNSDPKWATDYGYNESHTWSGYFLETVNGRVELWFLGESNGYYSESMGFSEIN
jgi:hypothetical protein